MLTLRFIHLDTLQVLGSIDVVKTEGGTAFAFTGKTTNYMFAFGIYFLDEEDRPIKQASESGFWSYDDTPLMRFERMLVVPDQMVDCLSDIPDFKPVRP